MQFGGYTGLPQNKNLVILRGGFSPRRIYAIGGSIHAANESIGSFAAKAAAHDDKAKGTQTHLLDLDHVCRGVRFDLGHALHDLPRELVDGLRMRGVLALQNYGLPAVA